MKMFFLELVFRIIKNILDYNSITEIQFLHRIVIAWEIGRSITAI